MGQKLVKREEDGTAEGIYSMSTAGRILEASRVSKNIAYLARVVFGQKGDTERNRLIIQQYLDSPTFIEMMEAEKLDTVAGHDDTFAVKSSYMAILREMRVKLGEDIVLLIEGKRGEKNDLNIRNMRDYIKGVRELMAAELGLRGIPVETKFNVNVNQTIPSDGEPEGPVDLDKAKAALDAVERRDKRQGRSFLPAAKREQAENAAVEDAEVVTG